jgi:hypothetical protein
MILNDEVRGRWPRLIRGLLWRAYLLIFESEMVTRNGVLGSKKAIKSGKISRRDEETVTESLRYHRKRRT